MKYKLTIYICYFLLIGLCGFLPRVNAAPGDLDFTFSQDGKIVDTLLGSSSNQGQATATQADGKIVIAGTLTFGTKFGCGIARYNLDGSLDTTFDGDGKAVGLIDTTFSCRALAIQPDGKIIVAGNIGSGSGADFALIRFNPNGSLDTSFDGDGKVSTGVVPGAYDIANAVAVQSDGKIVAAGISNAGSNSNFAVVRYNSDGSLDNSFDGDGKISTDFFNTVDAAYAVAVQTDGKIVAAGYSLYSNEDFALIRYNSDGSLDNSFDGDGKVITDIEGSNGGDRAYSVAVQVDGKIVAAGSSNNFSLARYKPNGSLDVSFDGDGKVTTPFSNFGSTAYSVAIQTDGKIVAAGNYYNTSGSVSNYDFALARYNTDGSLDPSFDGEGMVLTPILNSNDSAYSVALQTDGKIIAAGVSQNGSRADFSLVRYNTNGSLDNSFDADGKIIPDLGFPTSSGASKVAIQPDGKIVAVGYVYNGANDDFAVLRYNPDGSRDTTFDGDGEASTDIIVNNINGERAQAVAIQPDGKIVVGGYCYPNNTTDFALVRYNQNGSLDTSFDGDGKVYTPLLGFEYVNALTIQSDGKIVAAGYTYNGSNNDIALVRYNSDGSLDASFGSGGKVITNFSNNEQVYGMSLQSDGKIVAAGYTSGGSGSDFMVVRYNSDGSLDMSFDADGKVITSVSTGFDGAAAVAIQTDGKILAAGVANNDFALVRYNSDGSLDTSFDSDGITTTNILGNDSLNAVAIQADGRIVAAGYSYPGALNNEGALARYNPDGSLDISYGTGGKLTFDILGGSNDFIYGLALDSIGRAVVVGATSGSITVVRVLGNRAPVRALYDYDGDGKSDVSLFRPSNGYWYLNNSTTGFTYTGFGISGDQIAPADYDGDGKTDLAVFRPSNGAWYLLRSSLGFTQIQFGASGDLPMPADFDGDGKAEIAIFRPSTGVWYTFNVTNNQTTSIAFGITGDTPTAADYDGDGKADLAVFRPSSGTWYLNRSQLGFTAIQFGANGDKAVPGDYDADGKADLAVWRPSTGVWYLQQSQNGFSYAAFGIQNDLPAPADYDGDGKTDLGIFRPSSGVWYLQRSTQGFTQIQFGANGDKPTPNSFVP